MQCLEALTGLHEQRQVEQDYLDARRQQILDAASVCFASNGFHATSMPDLFAAAGLSAGAVYRYFSTARHW